MNTDKLQHESVGVAPRRRVSIVYTSTNVTDQLEGGMEYDDIMQGEWEWFTKLDGAIISLWLLMLTENFYVFTVIGPHNPPRDSLFNSIRLLIGVVIVLGFVVHYIWRYAARRAAYNRAKRIIYANQFYGPLIKQVQKEILEALHKGTYKDEPLATP